MMKKSYGLIEYDANGNMTKMPDKGITSITYNHLNLPKEIAQVNNTRYYYRADGVKIRKAFTLNNSEGSTVTNSEYLDGFQYVTRSAEIAQAFKSTDEATMDAKTAGQEETFVSRIDEANAVPQPQTMMVLSFFPTAEGFYDVENSKYIYQYKDHLGNVRVSYYNDDNTNTLEVADRNDFYPFGMNFVGYYSVFDAQGSLYNYKYNGKELQETGFYDYGWRQYASDIGRWIQLDPLVEDTEDPYAYVLNNPIKLNDPDGRAPEDGVEEGCCSGLKGFSLAVLDNITGGNLAQRYNDGSPSYNKGVLNGNVASGVAGAFLAASGGGDIAAGGTTLAASTVATETVVGAEVGVPGMAVGGGLILTGTLKVAVGANLMSNASKNIQDNNSRNSSSNNNSSSSSSNKVEKSKTTTTVGKEGKYTKTTEVRPSKQAPGQSRAEYSRVKNKDGKVIKTYKDSYDRANKFQHRKPLTGGPEGRPAN